MRHAIFIYRYTLNRRYMQSLFADINCSSTHSSSILPGCILLVGQVTRLSRGVGSCLKVGWVGGGLGGGRGEGGV